MLDNCGHHCDCGCGCDDKKKECRRKIVIGVAIFVHVLIAIAFILWLLLRCATKPVFAVQNVNVVNFNLTGSPPNSLTSTFQLTIQCRNPNDRISIDYDSLKVYATYRTQPISTPTSIPPTCQDTNGVNVWSPFVTGVMMPIAPYVGEEISQDETAGNLAINFQMDGRLRWRIGAFVFAYHNLRVNCLAYFAYGDAVKYQLCNSCSVSL